MLTSRGVVRTARTLVVCLTALLVCPAFGEIAALAARQSAPCSSSHACCRRAGMNGACPHEAPAAAHNGPCSRTVCVLTCNDHHESAVVPVVLIGFFPAAPLNWPNMDGTTLGATATPPGVSVDVLPSTPPPRTARV